MGKAARNMLDQWDLWDPSPGPMPARSALYSDMEPIGVGTAQVERLTCYISRLAAAHCVSPIRLLHDVIVPKVGHYQAHNKGGQGLEVTDSTSRTALVTLESLELLTTRSDLRTLTLVPWMNVMDATGALRNKKAWCADCYREWRVAGQSIYDPLLWSFTQIIICVKDQQYLRDRCPYEDCARSSLTLGWKSRPGYCSYCQRWLGTSSAVASSLQSIDSNTEDIQWQIWVTETLGDLLALSPAGRLSPLCQQVSNALEILVNQTAGGNIRAFARLVRTGNCSVRDWIKRGIRPKLAALLHVCFACGITLSDLLQANPKTLQPVVTATTTRSQVQRCARFSATFRFDVQQELQNTAASEKYPPISLAEVARRCGCLRCTLRRSNPAACDVISARYRAYVRHMKEQRLRDLGDKFRSVGRQFRSQKIAFSHRQVARHLGRRRLFNSKEVRDLFRQVRLELEREISLE